MRTPHWFVYTALLLSVGSPVFSAPPPAEAFGHVPRITDVAINPKGNLLAWGDANREPTRIVIHDLDTKTDVKTFPVPDKLKLRELAWSDDDTLLLRLGFTEPERHSESSRYEWSRMFAVDATTGKARILLNKGDEKEWVTGASIHSLHTGQPNTVVMSTMEWTPGRARLSTESRLSGDRRTSGWTNNLFEVDTTDGKGRTVNFGTPYTEDWVVDESGRAVARSEWEPDRKVFTIVRLNAGSAREIYRQTDGEILRIFAWDKSRDAVIGLGSRSDGLHKMWSIPLDGSPPSVAYESPDGEASAVYVDPFTNAPLGAIVGGITPRVQWLDSTMAAHHKTLLRTFPGRDVEIMGRTRDHARVVVRTVATNRAPVYHVVDFARKKADIVGEAYPGLEGRPLGEVRTITYAARDGETIPAYVTVPPGLATVENLPLVVVPHGGPAHRDFPEFDWMAQFFATRGYAVLQPQFRGSSGFGDRFENAGVRQWGGLMQDDVTDAVKALVEKKWADPQRICIVGGNYGGYSALAGAAFTPNLYACAASVGGISDLTEFISFWENKAGDKSDTVEYWLKHIGPKQDDHVRSRSPRRAVDAIRAPILLIHGTDDTVVPPSQSRSMAKALQARNKPVKYVELQGEDHWLSHSATRIQFLKEIETFLAEHLKPSTP